MVATREWADRAKAGCGERRARGVPRMSGVGKPVREQHERPLPLFEISEAHTVGDDVAEIGGGHGAKGSGAGTGQGTERLPVEPHPEHALEARPDLVRG